METIVKSMAPDHSQPAQILDNYQQGRTFYIFHLYTYMYIVQRTYTLYKPQLSASDAINILYITMSCFLMEMHSIVLFHVNRRSEKMLVVMMEFGVKI